MMRRYLFTSESVSEGHPDKLADQISDSVLDAYLTEDFDSKVACETFITAKGVILAGEVHSSANFSFKQIEDLARKVIKNAGYTNSAYGYDYEDIWVMNYLHEQSHEIRKGVDEGGAGDQGLMFGFACDETKELMPLAISLAHKIMQRQAVLRKSGEIPWLLPDAKSQVSVIYEDGIPVGIDTIIVSTQHMPMVLSGGGHHHSVYPQMAHGHYQGAYHVSNGMIEEAVIESIIKPVLPEKFRSDNIKYMINPSGRFEIGGPTADTGLTGRKIIVDTYGGSCPHGGGAFSGKDASKVDRSGAYMARYIAKNIVAAGVADKCMVQIAYAIGKADPVSFMLDFLGRGLIPESRVQEFILENVDLRPRGIIEKLKLQRPIFQNTAAYGHFGRELPEFLWETDFELRDKLQEGLLSDYPGF